MARQCVLAHVIAGSKPALPTNLKKLYSALTIMKTFLNQPIEQSTLGILYLCKYTYVPSQIEIIHEIQFDNTYDALEAYSNIRNPESQLASGNTQEELFVELEKLHNNFNNPQWVKQLGEYL